jgi:hypothetical protein
MAEKIQLSYTAAQVDEGIAKAGTAVQTETFDEEVTDINSRINALAGLGGALPHNDFGASASVTDETLTEYACQSIWGAGGSFTWNSAEPWNSTYVIDDTTHTAVEIFNSTWVRNDNDNHKFVLTNTPTTNPQVFDWSDVGIDTVAQFTDTLSGVILGDSDTFGKVKSNSDGTGSVNGLDNTGDGTKALMDDGAYGYTLNYSTSEVKCGTWIDGKPIYKKTYYNTATSTSTISYLVIDADFWTSGKRLIKVEGIGLRNNDTLRRQIPSTWIGTTPGSTDEALMYDCSNATSGNNRGLYLNMLTKTGNFSWGIYTTTYYTKTTD